MKKINKFFTGSIIGVTILTLLSSWLYDKFKAIPVLNFLLSLFVSIKNFIAFIFFLKVSLWLVFVIILSIAIVVWFYKKVTIQKLPAYTNYTEEIFKNWVWKWQYDYNWKPIQLEPYCPYCNVKLIVNNIGSRSTYWLSSARCPACNREWESRDNPWKTVYYKPETEYVDETINLIEANINQLVQANMKA